MKLKEIRKKKGLTQTEVGELLGLSKGSIHNIETGKQVINHNQIIKLCEALDVRAGVLLGLEEDSEDFKD